MDAKTILQLLANRHSDDIFVSECKNGPSYDAVQLRRMDAWVMPRSWRHLSYIGYEIKVSRADFLKDKKWGDYLPLCNEFYFVCPSGMIKPDEVPAEAGLMYASKTGSRLFIKKKAPKREIAVPIDVINYVLICRARVQDEPVPTSRTEFWKRWLAGKVENHQLGRNVSRRFAAVIRENARLKNSVKNLLDHVNELTHGKEADQRTGQVARGQVLPAEASAR